MVFIPFNFAYSYMLGCLQIQILLSGLTTEVPRLLHLIVSRAFLPSPSSEAASSAASASHAKFKGNLFEAKETGQGLVAALQMLATEPGGPLLVKEMNREYRLDELCLGALQAVS